ncbi:MAG TPA: hypothetical protein PLZ93_24935 [Nocardioides sp.]|uniref:hypothetical protein n=1 Tax=uncultured Nocardioides sp. TaxID=198441 RepID=UPI000ECAC6EC|nr:hypothetical protein [uncultured Nocardioides sp.]HCB06198.1 hypothetical protein [Nocardioides sp.]HRD64510.1 hypothetical protein [Nocardioides sp.]HRI98896.1 hypothetical protein [Nocardioides sp.]
MSESWASDPLGLSTIGSQYVGEWMATLMEIGLALDMLQAFTKTSRWGTPVVGIAATLGGLLVMAPYGWLVGLASTVTVGLGIYGSIRPLPTDQTPYGVYIAGPHPEGATIGALLEDEAEREFER